MSMKRDSRPTRNAVDEEPVEPASAREKVLRHLRTAVVAGTGLALACSGPSSGGAQQTAPADEPKEGPPIVCDPLPPPPLTCQMQLTNDDIRSTLSTEARIVKTAEGLAVAVQLRLDGWRKLPGLKITADPKVQSAKAISKERHDDQLKLTCLPDRGQRTFRIAVPMACATKTLTVAIDVRVPDPLREKQEVTVSVSLS